MAQYVKATNFASKDALLTGDPNKIVKGAEIDDEFNNIQTGINSKADTLSPTLTGTPLAPTATAGTNTTQVATTAFVTTAVTNERSAAATLTNKTLTSPIISGGSVTGITDLSVADGGTGSSTAAGARTNLGLVIGTDVQAYDADLTTLGGLSKTDGNFIVGNGSTWVAESGSTARSSLGLGSIATQASNSVSITGGSVSGITDLAVADGGTGASNAADARTNLGLIIGTDVAPVVSPALTGTPTSPTASFGTSSTQIATTAFVQAALQAVYPVGSIYISTSATNPGTTFGFGTWAAFGAGKVLVGQDAGDASFDTLEETGGSKDAIVVSHTHTTVAAGAATGAINTATFDFGNIQSASGVFSVSGSYPSRSQGAAGTGSYGTANLSIPDHTHDVASTGSAGTNANLQPYIVVKMWKRTA
jgi:hypothetical protein